MKDEYKSKKKVIFQRPEAYPIRIKAYVWGLGIIWSLVVAASLMWNVYQKEREILDFARYQARVAYEKDVIYRRWNARHGGVYVPVTEESPPNPHLKVSERDINTPSGIMLTRMNPAYMTRQVHEMATEEYGVKGHITSLNPIRPANTPDQWETEALQAFAHGAKEVSSLQEMEGQPYLRLMRPLLTEHDCLKCHAVQGYKLGDVRGGISVSLPMTPLWAIGRSQIVMLCLWHSFLWLFGLIGLGFGGRRLAQQITERKQAEVSLRQSEERFRVLSEASFEGIAFTEGGRLIDANTQLAQMLGYDLSEIIGKPVSDMIHPEDWELVKRNMETGYGGTYENRLLRKDQSTLIVETRAIQFNYRGRIVRATVLRDISEHKRGEVALRESEMRLRTILESIQAGVIVVDAETRQILDINSTASKLIGASKEEILNHVCHKYICPAAKGKCPVNDLGQAVDNSERLLLDHKGREIHILKTVVPVKLTGRDVLLESFIDITERKRAEEALRESEATLKSIFRVAPIGIGLVTDRILKQVNDCLCEMIGYSKEELVGKSSRILYPSQEEFEWVGRVKYAQISQRGTGTVETHWQKKDGAMINVLLSSTPLDPIDPTAGVTFTALDISERKRAESALSESQARFRELAELLPETIFEMDTSGNLTFVNRNAFDHFGYSQEDFEHGLNGFELVSPEDRPRALENAKRVMSGEKIGLSEYKVLRKDGTTFPAIMHTTTKLHDGKPLGLRGIVIDITETKKLESQLRQAHKMEAIGTLTGGIAHDFNNLLQVVQGYAELLLLRKTEGESEYKVLLEISRAAKRGGELTRQLLTFSRKVESKLQPIDLNRAVDDIRRLLERTIPKMIKIELHLMGNLHSVNADASQIEQILMNLALNARDAMADGGTLTIETKNLILDEDHCHTQPELTPGKYVLLAVSDTGHGMDKTTLEHIFDPFFTTKEVGKGTGLGLAMVYGIVKNHHGHITCMSDPDEGTAFKIYFPAMEQLEEALNVITGATEPRGGNETLLLVDDDDSVRELGQEILQRYGYTVISVPDGESALQLYRDERDRIDLVVLDLIMPGMGGAQCLQKLLEIDPQAKIVIASGYSVPGQQERTTEIGAKAFINKPYDVQEMLKVVREILD